MEIFTFRARSLQEALMLVRHELGPEASIVQTREVSGKFFGLLGKPQIEVQASREAKVVRRIADATTGNEHALTQPAGMAVAEKAPQTRSDKHPFADDRFDMTEEDISGAEELLRYETESASDEGLPASSVHRAVQPMRPPSGDGGYPMRQPSGDGGYESKQPSGEGGYESALQQPPGGGGYESKPSSRAAGFEPPAGAPNYLTPAMFEVFTEMLDADVDPDAARLMLQEVALHCSPAQLNDPWLIKGRLCQIIQQRISVSGPIDVHSGQPQIVALVGPTGVGKTTTLAKLAAGFHFDQGIQVGMITLDTFRMGAVDQLQKYADLLGAACEVVQSPDQMVPAIYRLRHCPLILIDTAGRSPRDQSQLKVLSEFLRAAEPTQTHLVLSAASSPAHAELAMDQFRQLNPTHLLLTKLDEALCLGSWYGPLASRQWPLSYMTTGQRVPEDIVTANSRRVASLILGQVRT